MDKIKKDIASCLRRVIEGKVSWDHLIEEYRRHKDMDIVEIVGLIEEISSKYDRYSIPKEIDEEEKKKLESIINRLEGAG